MEWKDFSLANLEASTTPLIYERGIDYLRQGHLLKACQINGFLAGVLTGTGGDYKVRLWFEHSELQGQCNCPYDGFCKHMVALAAAWIEDKARFFDLQPKLAKVLENPASQTDFLLKLIDKDPINFLELFPEENIQLDFINARGVLNLIRNTFSAPQITAAEAETLWEKVKRIGELISVKFKTGDPQAPELLMELISGLEKAVEVNHNETLNRFFIDFIHSIHPNNHNPTIIKLLIEKLLAIYLNSNLWDFTDELKPVLLDLSKYNPDFLSNLIDGRLNSGPPLITLISLYGLLAEVSPDNILLYESLCKVTEIINSLPDGRLWLIDHLTETNLDQAYKIAKTSLGLFNQEKASIRERLIVIHQKRGELRQAASLSFIQFQEKPNFEEYLRLKMVLSKHPLDWKQYRGKINHLLEKQGLEILTLRIMIEEQDLEGITQNLEQMLADSSLLMAVAKLFASKIEAGFTQLYPRLIKVLLDRRTPGDWKAALQLLITFKRYCNYNVAKKEEWLLLCDELRQIYQEDGGFAKKFGNILAG